MDGCVQGHPGQHSTLDNIQLCFWVRQCCACVCTQYECAVCVSMCVRRCGWTTQLCYECKPYTFHPCPVMACPYAQSSGVNVLDTALETQLCYECKTFLLAGHETSAAMLTWSLLELGNLPGCMSKVQAEADEVFGSKEQEPRRREVRWRGGVWKRGRLLRCGHRRRRV